MAHFAHKPLPNRRWDDVNKVLLLYPYEETWISLWGGPDLYVGYDPRNGIQIGEFPCKDPDWRLFKIITGDGYGTWKLWARLPGTRIEHAKAVTIIVNPWKMYPNEP
jgi:hypothetical protein